MRAFGAKRRPADSSTFTDVEGDSTTLRASPSDVGILELEINGERFDGVGELEFIYDGHGGYSIFMSGIGATIADPPPGPAQHKLCQRIIEIAGTQQVPVRCRNLSALAQPSPVFFVGWPMRPQSDDTFAYEQGSFVSQCCADGFFNYREAGQNPSACSLGPKFGYEHRFHTEVSLMGSVKGDYRKFTKTEFEGRLSVVAESQVKTDGIHKYCVQFTSGALSKADGVGFIFSSQLPCKKNIQKIVSIFVSQRGRICTRIYQDVIYAPGKIKALKLGDWIELTMDLDSRIAYFAIWPGNGSQGKLPRSAYAQIDFGNTISDFLKESGKSHEFDLSTGHLACVVKNEGVTLTLGS